MQQTKSYWRVVAVAGVIGAFVGSACVVTTSTDDSTAGAGGTGATGATAGTNTTAGTGTGATTSAGTSSGASAGTATAGTTSTGGNSTGGSSASTYQCDMGEAGAPAGTPSACTPATDDCSTCVCAHCSNEYGTCYATNPGNQCGYGGPAAVAGGELICVQKCISDGFADAGVDDETLRGMCFSQCSTTIANGATTECGGLIGSQTNALIGCMYDHCTNECFGG